MGGSRAITVNQMELHILHLMIEVPISKALYDYCWLGFRTKFKSFIWFGKICEKKNEMKCSRGICNVEFFPPFSYGIVILNCYARTAKRLHCANFTICIKKMILQRKEEIKSVNKKGKIIYSVATAISNHNHAL